MSSPADAFIQMGRPKQQEGGNDGFRDAIPEKFPGVLHKWRERITIVTGEELKNLGYHQPVAPADAFLLGELSPMVLETIQAGNPPDADPGKWVRHLHDLTQQSWQRVRFNDQSNPLADLANVRDSESALRFVKRYGFPTSHYVGLFEFEATSDGDRTKPIVFALPRPVASINDILQEARFLRSIARLIDSRNRELPAVELREIEKSINDFAATERLPAMTLEGSLRLFQAGKTNPPSVEELRETALLAADARINRLVRPSNTLKTNPVVFEAHSILGFIYWQLRRYLVGKESVLRQCANERCLVWFTPATEATIHCSEACRRQSYERGRSRNRTKTVFRKDHSVNS